MKKMYTINEVAKLFDITTNKIRFYEKKGLIKPVRNEINGYREYVEEDLIRVQLILMYRLIGFSIEDIKEILLNGKKNNLDHFHKQWKIVNDEIHRLHDIRNSLESVIDSLYEDSEINDEVLEIIEKTNSLNKMKNQWIDKWNFDDWASTYDDAVKNDGGILRIYENYDEILETVFEKAKSDIKKSDQILEIGVGTGNLACKFLDENYNIVGIDQSREMLNKAKEKFPKLKVRLGEFMKIPFENNTIDVVVSTYAFHHLNDGEKRIAIKEMIRVLKDDGKIVIGDLMFKDDNDKKKIFELMSGKEIEIVEDEYYSNIDFLKSEFNIYEKKIEYTRIDKLNYIVEIE